MTITDLAELYICLILTVEFFYDYFYNTREQQRKRRAKQSKKETITYDKGILNGN